jgi:hypothetical protein
VRQRLAEIVAAAEAHADADAFQEEPRAPLPSVQEYVALVTLQTSDNFACIARARTEPKQKREADDAVAVPELIERHGEEDDGEADGQIEAAALRAQAGLATMGADTRIVHHFQTELLQKVLRFETAERTQGFVKEFLKTPVMQLEEGLPLPRSQEGAEQRAAYVTQDLQQRYATLSHLEPDELKSWWKRKESFGSQRTFRRSRTRIALRPPQAGTAVVYRTRKNIPTNRLRGAAPSHMPISRPATPGAARAITWRTSRRGSKRGPSTRPLESECLAV